MSGETPQEMHGRLKEGAHLAGYSLERALDHFQGLLEDERYKALGFEDINSFLRSVEGSFSSFRLLADQRKAIVRLIRASDPVASERAIAGVVGANQRTIRDDIGKPRALGDAKASPGADVAEEKGHPPDALASPQAERSGKRVAAAQPSKWTAVLGDNARAVASILAIYRPGGGAVLDMTWGKGTFWKDIDPRLYAVTGVDADPDAGVEIGDFRNLRFEDSAFDVVAFDPPYKMTGTPQERDRYGNEAGGWRVVEGYYADGIPEAARVAKPGGIVLVKCMDQVVSGEQVWMHRLVYDLGKMAGLEPMDLALVVRESGTPQPKEVARHLWKNHSYLWVFQKQGLR